MKLTTMKCLLFIAFAAGLLVLERRIILAETFTEGVRVSPETLTLKPGEYVWEPERATGPPNSDRRLHDPGKGGASYVEHL
jgi:hypothetical protein